MTIQLDSHLQVKYEILVACERRVEAPKSIILFPSDQQNNC